MGLPLASTSVDSFTPPAALARFHSALPQGSFLPSPAPLGPGGPRSLPPRHPPQNPMDTPTSAGGLENKRFARPGAPITVCTSPGATASSTPSSRQTPSGTIPPPAPWTPTSCNPWDILKPQLISAICMMMEHLHFDCCI